MSPEERAKDRVYGPNELHDALNMVEPGEFLDFTYIRGDKERKRGGGIFHVSEVIEPFGDGAGHIRCENDVDDVITDIRELPSAVDERVGIYRNGGLEFVGGYVLIEE